MNQILQSMFIMNILILLPDAADDGSNYLCVYKCNDDHYPNSCNSDNVVCSDYTLNPDDNTEHCPLFGEQIFSSMTECQSFQTAESNSLYCLYKCSDTDFPNACLPKGQVCPSTHQETGCPLYHEPVIFNGASSCEDFRENGWAIEDCISCCYLAEKVTDRWSEIIDDGCGVVYDTVIFGASIGIGVAATPAAAVAFDVFMIGVDGVTAVFSNKYDGLGDMICDAVSDASSELIALEKARDVCGDIMEGCSECEFQVSNDAASGDITCEEAKDITESDECKCFARNSVVITFPNFEEKPIHELEIGEKVLTYDDAYNAFVFDEVISIAHKEGEAEINMLSLIFDHERGQNNITLTPKHLLYINGNIAPALSAEIGDYLSLYHNEIVRIQNVVKTKEQPFNVWTHNGNIVVNQVSATIFADSTFGIYAREIMQYGYKYPWFKAIIGFVTGSWNNVYQNQLIKSFMRKC